MIKIRGVKFSPIVPDKVLTNVFEFRMVVVGFLSGEVACEGFQNSFIIEDIGREIWRDFLEQAVFCTATHKTDISALHTRQLVQDCFVLPQNLFLLEQKK